MGEGALSVWKIRPLYEELLENGDDVVATVLDVDSGGKTI